jgi:predicted  nucleic acid-binding Zn-ribbon protein
MTDLENKTIDSAEYETLQNELAEIKAEISTENESISNVEKELLDEKQKLESLN